MTALLVEATGKIKLPQKSLKRYGWEKSTLVRLIETKEGILLVPMHNAPMNKELQSEIAEWQDAASETWDTFTYETK